MSTQGGTLQSRRTIELPMWPVAVLVVVAIAAAIGMATLGDAGQTSFVTSVSDSPSGSPTPPPPSASKAPRSPSSGYLHGTVTTRLHECDDRDGMGFDRRSERSPAPPVQRPARCKRDGCLGFDRRTERSSPPPVQPSPGRRGTGAHRDPIIVNGEPCMQCR